MKNFKFRGWYDAAFRLGQETHQILFEFQQTRWAWRSKSRSRSQDVSSLAFYHRRIPNRKVHELYAIKNCQVLVKNFKFRGWYDAAFRLGQETHQILFEFQQTRWASRSKSRSRGKDVSSLAFYHRRIPNRKVHELYAINFFFLDQNRSRQFNAKVLSILSELYIFKRFVAGYKSTFSSLLLCFIACFCGHWTVCMVV